MTDPSLETVARPDSPGAPADRCERCERCGMRLRRQPGRIDLGVLVVLASVLALAGAATLAAARVVGNSVALGIPAPGVVFLVWFVVAVRENRVLHCNRCGITRLLRRGPGIDRLGPLAPLIVSGIYFGWTLAVTLILQALPRN